MSSFLAGGEPSLSSEGIDSVYEVVMAEYLFAYCVNLLLLSLYQRLAPGLLLEDFTGQNQRDNLRMVTLIPLVLLFVHSACRAHAT